MSGHVGIIATDAGRYTLFALALSELQKPANTRTIWQLVNDRAHGRNAIVEQALNEGSDWVLFLDDDHAFPHTLLQRLLSHDLPVVGALYVQRQAPFRPVAYAADDTKPLTSLRLPDLPADGLVPVRAMGTGGMLIRAEVLREVGAPWFESETGRSEDIVFCEKLWRLRVPMHVDTGCRMGHLSMMSTWPSYHDGTWTIGFQLADGFSMQAPIQD